MHDHSELSCSYEPRNMLEKSTGQVNIVTEVAVPVT